MLVNSQSSQDLKETLLRGGFLLPTFSSVSILAKRSEAARSPPSPVVPLLAVERQSPASVGFGFRVSW